MRKLTPLLFAPLTLLALLLLVAPALAADTPAPPVTGWSTEGVIALIALLVGGAGMIVDAVRGVLHFTAPRTATTVDDRAAAALDAIHERLSNIETKLPPAARTLGPIAMLALFVLAVSGTPGCATTSSTVKSGVTTLEGCSAADATAIVTASSKIVDDLRAADRTAAAIDVIAQLAVIHTAWSRCKGAAPPTVAPAAARVASATGAAPADRPGRAAFQSDRAAVAGGASFRTAAGLR